MIMESENKKVRRRSSTSSSLKRPGGGGGGVGGGGGGLVGVRNLLEAARASVGGSVPSIHSSNQSLSPSDIFAKGDEGEEEDESDFDTSTMIPTFSNHHGACNDEFSGHTRIITITEVTDTTTNSTGSSKNPTFPSQTLPSLLYNDSMIFDDNIEIHDLISEEQPHKPQTTTSSSSRERSSKMPPSSSPRRAAKNPSSTATPTPRVRQQRRNSTGQQQIATSSSIRPKEEPSPPRPPSPAAIPSWAAHVGTIFVAVASNHDEEACDCDDMHPAFRVEEKPTVRRVKNTSNSKNPGIKKKRPTGETTIRKPNRARPQQQQERNGDRPISSNMSNRVSSGTNSSPRRTSKARQDEHMEIGSSSSDNNTSKTSSSTSRPKKTSTTTKPQNSNSNASPDGTPRRMRRRVSLDSKRTQICSSNNNINKCEIRPTPPLRKKTISMDNERHQVFHNNINDINKKPSRPPTIRRTTNGTPAAKQQQQQKGLDDDDSNNNNNNNASCNIIMSPSTTTRRASKTSTNNLITSSSRPQGKRPRRLSQ